MVGSALEYASFGWPVFPTHWSTSGACSCGRDCASPGKHPLTRNGLKDASTEASKIWRWWQQSPQANIGIRTGSPGPLYVVDLDGDAGLAAWDALAIVHEAAPTRTARTGGGGRHLYYRMPLGERLPNTAGKLAKKVDTRGEGGYVLAPPSTHKSGNAYAWINDEPVADLPSWVITVLSSKLPKQPAAPPRDLIRDGRKSSAYGEAVLMGAMRRIKEAKEGERNERLNYEAFLVAQYISGGEIEPHGVLEALVDSSTDPDVQKSYDTARRALQEGAQYPRKKLDGQ